ncbi:glycerate kinase [Agrococcus sp. ARC_14]|uniref:glycerate kinase n=1 Tax=Agrococcus sp. ARC_14 TaxID=2919927 RepID=UPI001F0615D7|nr:glycerate kinase [Agrococcus sp. ARC_14]MCH1883322.1 glycerate kinase [Agrococcus sp. ARC_14]
MPGRRRPLIVAAPDSFKGSCSAAIAAQAMLEGARSVFGDDADYLALPLADGGEGTLDAMLAAWGQEPRQVQTTDALGRPRRARYGLSRDRGTAIIEAAEANGLPWVADQPLQPLDADTAGVGTIALAALADGADALLLCIGGSATSDGGVGLLTALGARFLDAQGAQVRPGARGLADVVRIDVDGLDARARDAGWRIAVDVDNPLCGPRGAAAVFGPQKGADAAAIAVIDAGLLHLAEVLAQTVGIDPGALLRRPGLGGAGGMALAAVALLGAETVAGSDLVGEAIGVRSAMLGASLVLTGEGQLDSQSLGGKVVDLVRREAPTGTPIVVIAGTVRLSAAECREAGITAAFSIADGPATLDELVADAPRRIAETAAHGCALLTAALRER